VQRIEDLKEVVLIIGDVLGIFLGEDLPDPRIEIIKEYPHIYLG